MKKLAALKALILAATLIEVGCDAEHQQRQPSNTPSAYTQEEAPRPQRSYSDMQLFQCVTDSALQKQKWILTDLKYRVAWTESMMHLMDQFRFTPWAEIPKEAQDRIKVMQAELRRQVLAEEAIRLKVPVSQMRQGCQPKFPHCFDPSHPDNQEQIGRVYGTVLSEALESFARASAEADGESLVWVMTHMNPEVSYLDMSSMIQKAIVDEGRKGQECIDKLKAFQALLPKSAVTPTKQWPEIPPDPISCRGIFKESTPGTN